MARDSALWIGGVTFSISSTYVTCNERSTVPRQEENVRNLAFCNKYFFIHLQLDKYMTEEFLKNAFSLMGEDSVLSIKVFFDTYS